MPNLVEHYLFKQQSKAVKTFLKEHMWLTRYPADMNVDIFYTTPERAFSKLIAPILNGGNLYPTITLILTGFEQAPNQMPSGYFKKYRQSDSDENVFEEMLHPLVYTLNYRVTMWTALQSDADILLYQAMSSAPQNRKFATAVDGQWMEIEVKTPQTESTLDPGEARDVAFRYGFDINVPRAYLPLNYQEYYGRILDTDVDTEDIIFDI